MVARALALTLWCTAALAQGAKPVPHVWNIPEAIEGADAPGRTDAFGTPVSMHAVRSRLKLEPLANDLVRQFEQAGLFIPPAGAITPSSSHVQLTGLDPDTFIAYTVFFQENPDGTTTAILTEAYLAERHSPASQVGFAPVMPHAKDLLVSHNEGLELAHYRVRASPTEIDLFHKQMLTQAGYHQTEPGVWLRGDDVLRFSFKAAEAGDVEVLIMHRRSPNADVAPREQEGGK